MNVIVFPYVPLGVELVIPAFSVTVVATALAAVDRVA